VRADVVEPSRNAHRAGLDPREPHAGARGGDRQITVFVIIVAIVVTVAGIEVAFALAFAPRVLVATATTVDLAGVVAVAPGREPPKARVVDPIVVPGGNKKKKKKFKL
jgi:hypothetical protein